MAWLNGQCRAPLLDRGCAITTFFGNSCPKNGPVLVLRIVLGELGDESVGLVQASGVDEDSDVSDAGAPIMRRLLPAFPPQALGRRPILAALRSARPSEQHSLLGPSGGRDQGTVAIL